jgi:mannitol/fructose-specific phosphotransferase system IIA component (Ntr-type)
MNVGDVLSVDKVLFRVEGKNKTEIIAMLLEQLRGDARVQDHKKTREAVRARESAMSTAVGNGLAIPTRRRTESSCRHGLRLAGSTG